MLGAGVGVAYYLVTFYKVLGCVLVSLTSIKF
jgi:hypothetical protein